MGAQKNTLNDTVLLSTQNICLNSCIRNNHTFMLKELPFPLVKIIIKIFECKIGIIFLFISLNMCFGSFEYPQHMLFWKNNFLNLLNLDISVLKTQSHLIRIHTV